MMINTSWSKSNNNFNYSLTYSKDDLSDKREDYLRFDFFEIDKISNKLVRAENAPILSMILSLIINQLVKVFDIFNIFEKEFDFDRLNISNIIIEEGGGFSYNVLFISEDRETIELKIRKDKIEDMSHTMSSKITASKIKDIFYIILKPTTEVEEI